MRFSSALLLLACPQLALGATLPVGPGQTYATIQAALDDARSGDVIEVAPGTYDEFLQIRVSVELVGTGGSGVTTLQFANQELIDVSNADFTLRGFTLAPDGARALDFQGGVLVVEDVRVQGHSSTRDGAAFRIREAGATLSHVRVEDVQTTREGAALYLDEVDLLVQDSAFLRNGAVRGGAIYVEDSDLILERTLFEANTASGGSSPDGGAISAQRATLDLLDSTFRANSAGNVGGALHLVGAASATLTGSVFLENTAEYGGAVYLGSAGSLTVDGAVFQDNSATQGSGGAIRWRSDGGFPAVHIVNSAFSRNTAPRGAGGALAYATNFGPRGVASITSSSFTGNSALIGGAVSIADIVDVSGVRNTFCANEAEDAAGVRLTSAGSFAHVWTNNIFNANTTTGLGGAMYLTQLSRGDVLHNTFVGNQAAEGGALYVHTSALTILNNVFAWTRDGHAVSSTASAGALDHNAWFDNAPADVSADLTAIGPNAVTADPLLIFVDDAVCTNDLLAPPAGSPLIDAGAPTVGSDPDGSPPDIGAFGGPEADLDLLLDEDGDGYNRLVDCDDTDDAVHPGADERCNGIDDDCDGIVDNDPVDAPIFYLDEDGDGYGGPTSIQTCGDPPPGYVPLGGDCDDGDANIHPGATEICNDIDDNCDGEVDEGLILNWYDDDDRDGFGDPDDVEASCEEIPGRVLNGDDCDDHDDTIYPGAPDTYGDGVDSDCDGQDGVAGEQTGPEKLVASCNCSSAGGSGSAWSALLLAGLIAVRRRRGGSSV